MLKDKKIKDYTLDNKVEYHYTREKMLESKMRKQGGNFGGKDLDNLIESSSFLKGIEYCENVSRYGNSFDREFRKKNPSYFDSTKDDNQGFVSGFNRGKSAYKYSEHLQKQEFKEVYRKEKAKKK